MNSQPSEAYCLNHLRTRDVDRYLCTLFLPKRIRRSVTALYAFDAEIAGIPAMVNEPMMGEIRLQWWRDVIGGERKGEALSNPLSNELLFAIDQHRLPISTLLSYLDARVFDLYNDPMGDMNGFETYAGETCSVLFNLAALTAGSDGKSPVDYCAGHAGMVWTIIRVLKSLPMQRASQRCLVPREMLNSAAVAEFFSSQPTPVHGDMVRALAKLAHHHLGEYKRHAVALEDYLRPIFLPLCLAPGYCKAFENAGARAASQPVDIAQWRKQITIWRSARKGDY